MSLVILIFSVLSNIKQSVFDHFHLQVKNAGKFKAQCIAAHFLYGSKKINSNFLAHLKVRHTVLLTFLVSLWKL